MDENNVYYYNPCVVFRLGFDPRDRNRSRSLLPRIEDYAMVPEGSVIVWDAHFGPNEGRTELQELQVLPDLEQLALFEPEVPFKVLGGYDYMIAIFRK